MNEENVRVVLKKLGVQVVDELNGWVRSLCPFALWKHDGGVAENPNFGVTHDDDDPSNYNCLVCGSRGSLAGLPVALAHARKTDLTAAKAYAKEIEREEILGGTTTFADWDDETSTSKEEEELRIRTFPSRREFLKHTPVVHSPEALRYLAGRGIYYDTAFKIGLRFDERRERILFPVRDYYTGRYVGCSGRVIWSEAKRKREEINASERLGKKIKIPKVRDYSGLEKRKCFLGTYGHSSHTRKRQARPYWIIVEGLLAYARLVQLGFGDATLAVLGSTMTEAKAQILIDSGRSVYHFSDPDEGGSKYLYGPLDKDTGEHRGGGALDKLYGEVVQFLPAWPDDLFDIDDLQSPQQVLDMMRDAELYVKASLTKGKQKSRFTW